MAVLSAIVVLFLFIHTFLPSTTVDTTSLGLLALLIFIWILPFTSAIKLPGNIEIDLNTESVAKAKRDVDNVTRSMAAQGTRIIGAPTPIHEQPIWKALLRSDVTVALAGLRLEIEMNVRQLAQAAQLPSEERSQSLTNLMTSLQTRQILTPGEADAVSSVVTVCNQAVHAERVSPEATQVATDLGDTVLGLLQLKTSRLLVPKPVAPRPS